MERVMDNPHSRSPASIITGWAAATASWFRARHMKREKNQIIQMLASQDERLLNDIGLSHPKLLKDLGHDPRELPGFFNAGTYLNPLFRNLGGIRKSHIGEQR